MTIKSKISNRNFSVMGKALLAIATRPEGKPNKQPVRHIIAEQDQEIVCVASLCKTPQIMAL
ncbi:MAG: hypothetical protein AAF217_06245 [Pseudomonadota bacterium]